MFVNTNILELIPMIFHKNKQVEKFQTVLNLELYFIIENLELLNTCINKYGFEEIYNLQKSQLINRQKEIYKTYQQYNEPLTIPAVAGFTRTISLFNW